MPTVNHRSVNNANVKQNTIYTKPTSHIRHKTNLFTKRNYRSFQLSYKSQFCFENCLNNNYNKYFEFLSNSFFIRTLDNYVNLSNIHLYTYCINIQRTPLTSHLAKCAFKLVNSINSVTPFD